MIVGVGAAVAVLTSHRKVLLIGDSLMFQSAPAITGELQARGFRVQGAAIGGSGLLDTRSLWLTRMQQLIDQTRPDIVVVEFIGNYGIEGTRPGIVDMTPQFYAAWAAAAQQATDILSSRHADVYWILGPPMAKPAAEAKLVTLDNIYLGLKAPASAAHRPLFVDAVRPFSDDQGHFLASVTGPDGKPIPLRTPDGTHLTPAGSQRFADAITAAIESTKR